MWAFTSGDSDVKPIRRRSVQRDAIRTASLSSRASGTVRRHQAPTSREPSSWAGYSRYVGGSHGYSQRQARTAAGLRRHRRPTPANAESEAAASVNVDVEAEADFADLEAAGGQASWAHAWLNHAALLRPRQQICVTCYPTYMRPDLGHQCRGTGITNIPTRWRALRTADCHGQFKMIGAPKRACTCGEGSAAFLAAHLSVSPTFPAHSAKAYSSRHTSAFHTTRPIRKPSAAHYIAIYSSIHPAIEASSYRLAFSALPSPPASTHSYLSSFSYSSSFLFFLLLLVLLSDAAASDTTDASVEQMRRPLRRPFSDRIIYCTVH
ncbi:unnamed protein product [Protopolystoma xenopodis]|uniref:Uncharacterized protein n=1 Tax=Protopolystoma xenopodis TaxID=117903 RepID=A0A3S5APC3_9PLAT|nr:unnamed protein product [Protopolystoma xenopodis]